MAELGVRYLDCMCPAEFSVMDDEKYLALKYNNTELWYAKIKPHLPVHLHHLLDQAKLVTHDLDKQSVQYSTIRERDMHNEFVVSEVIRICNIGGLDPFDVLMQAGLAGYE